MRTLGMAEGRFGWAFLLAMSILPLGVSAAQQRDQQLDFATKDPSLPSVAIIATGGTIAERIDPKTGGAIPALSGKDLVDAAPDLGKLANIGVLDVSDIDSSQMTPEQWARLSAAVDRVLVQDDIQGAVITHGTDTMAEGAYFLDVTLQTDKPVVFTGALNAASSVSPDGPGNLLDAVTQVLSPQAHDWGVTVTLNRYVNSARDARKMQTTNVQAFTSGEKGYLGYVYGGKVQRFNDRVRRVRVPLPEPLPTELPDVPFISDYAGADGRFVRHAIDTGAAGLVVDGVGAGNVDAKMYEAIQYALGKDVPVVISSRVYYGAVEPIYGDQGGGKTLVDAGAILAGDLMGSKARLLLMLGLMHHGNDADELRRLFAY